MKAQVVKRVQDKWVGFELSQRVQKRFKNMALSAGRVQSIVLGWIVEREKEYKESEKIFSSFLIDGGHLEVEGEIQADKITVEEINKVEEEKMPLPPYTTDTALSEISRVLKVSANEVMALLQELFERGFITYHRTDST